MMVKYQRFLREKKQVLQEELEILKEVNKFVAKMNRLKPTPATVLSGAKAAEFADLEKKAQDLENLKSKPMPSLTDDEVRKYVSLSQEAGETPPRKVLDKHSSLGGSGPASGPGSSSGSGSGSSGDIYGDTITEIINSAGGSAASVADILSIIRSVLDKTDLRLSDNSFLS